MTFVLDRRSFRIQVVLAGAVLAMEIGLNRFRGGGFWLPIWAGSMSGILLPLILLQMLLAIFLPSWSQWIEGRRASQGRPVTLTPQAQGLRSKHWVSPVPYSAWAAVGLCTLLVLSAHTDWVPRIAYGYQGTLGQNTYVAWLQEPSPDGRWVAVDASPLNDKNAKTLSIVARDTGRTIAYPLSESPRHLTWSHDSRWLGMESAGNLWVLDQSKGSLEKVGLIKPSHFRFHPNGCLWALCESGLWAWDPSSNSARQLINSEAIALCSKGYQHEPNAMDLSPDGRLLALRYNSQIRVLETEHFGEIGLWTTPEHTQGDLRFLPGNKLLMAQRKPGTEGTSLLRFEAVSGRLLNRVPDAAFAPNPLESADVSPDGRWLATLRKDRSVAV